MGDVGIKGVVFIVCVTGIEGELCMMIGVFGMYGREDEDS